MYICVITFTLYNVKPTIANLTKIVSTIAKQWNGPHLIKIDIQMNIVVRYEQKGIYENKINIEIKRSLQSHQHFCSYIQIETVKLSI